MAKLKPGGIWYFNELLPMDFPSHWIYRVLPATWEWVKENTWSLYIFYNRLQGLCQQIKLKRHVFVQSLTYQAAEDILNKKKELTQQTNSLTSDFTIIEGWAKKSI